MKPLILPFSITFISTILVYLCRAIAQEETSKDLSRHEAIREIFEKAKVGARLKVTNCAVYDQCIEDYINGRSFS